jgi:DNA-binding transcriptional MerR regulator
VNRDTPAGLTIEQVADRTGITKHTLRYYERIGLLEPVGRAASGHRRYGEADVEAVMFLTLLRETGMSIKDMTRFVHLTREGDQTVPSRIDVLAGHRAEVVATIDLLQGHLKALDHKIDVYRTKLDADAGAAGSPERRPNHAP